MGPALEIKAAVTEPLHVKTITTGNGSVSVISQVTGTELFCSMPPDVENSGRPISSSSTGAIKGDRADVLELIRRAREGSHCPMDDYNHLETPSQGPKDYLVNL